MKDTVGYFCLLLKGNTCPQKEKRMNNNELCFIHSIRMIYVNKKEKKIISIFVDKYT
jgi:hypothetical protein